MKRVLPYLVVFIVSTLAAGLVFLVIALVSPQTLAPVTSEAAVEDSSKAHAIAADSTGRDTTFAAADSTAGADTTAFAATGQAEALPDSAHVVIQDSADTLNRLAGLARTDSARSQEWKNLAKVFEAMEPEKAAAILRNLSDEEIRTTILVLKRRQAAKILAALDPDRAAKIMR